MYEYLLTILLFAPLPFLLAVLALPRDRAAGFRSLLVMASLTQLLLCVSVFVNFPAFRETGGSLRAFSFLEDQAWFSVNLGSLGELAFRYTLGVDGLSASMLLLSGIVLFLGALASSYITENLKTYAIVYLVLCITVPGCFVALDFLLFYVFFEFMLLPMFFLIGIWGGLRKAYSALKFFLYTLFGSLLILLPMVALVGATQGPEGEMTLNFVKMSQAAYQAAGGLLEKGLASDWRFYAFLSMVLGFAVKLPAVPLHTWLPDAHVEAPTPVSVVLAGILLKIGGYGLLRFPMALFPDLWADAAWWLGLAGVISIVYGAFNALAQKDLKKMIAYSSVSHMGFVTLGLASGTPEGISGAIFQLFSHGLLSAALFLLAGVLYHQTHDRSIDHYAGLAKPLPFYAAAVALAFFGALGMPGFSGFIGEVLVIMGAFAGGLPIWMPFLAGFGIVLSAGYFLWTYRKMFLGRFWLMDEKASLKDLSAREILMVVPPILLALLFGLQPNWLMWALRDFVSGLLGGQ